MNKNIIIIIVLAVLLVISIGFGIYSFQKNTKGIEPSQAQITILEQEKEVLQQKVNKGLAYAKSLDLLYEPMRKQMNLTTRYSLTDVEWVSEFSKVTKAIGDDTLNYLLKDIMEGGVTSEKATVRFMERATSAIIDVLK
jgi:hypothetical protein